MAIKKVAKTADAARKGAMTKTVVKKVSPNVKIIKAGSKPLTQSLSEKRAIMEKAKTKTPAARAQTTIDKKAKARRTRSGESTERNYVIRETYRDALRSAGYKSPSTGMGDAPTAAQRKAANKAVAQVEREYKTGLAARKARQKAERAAAAKAARQNVGGGGLRGGFGMGSGGGSGRSNVNR